MDAKEHSDVWRRAARLVGGLDPRTKLDIEWEDDVVVESSGGSRTVYVGKHQYTETQKARWDGYRYAASIMNMIADEYAAAE